MQYDVRDVARMMGVAESQVYRWINEARMPAGQVNGKFVFNRAELLEWATQRRLTISKELFADGSAEEPGLAAVLASGGVVHHLSAADKDAALRAVVGALPLPPSADREALCELFLARESAGSTAVGDGVAIPHPRYPVILPLDRPVLGVFYLAQPIEFGAPDLAPVHTLFVLACPTMRTHLHLLSRLAGALRDPAFHEAVSKRSGLDALVAAAGRLERAAAARIAVPADPPGVKEKV